MGFFSGGDVKRISRADAAKITANVDRKLAQQRKDREDRERKAEQQRRAKEAAKEAARRADKAAKAAARRRENAGYL